MRCGVGDYAERLAHALERHAGASLRVLTSNPGTAHAPAGDGSVWRGMKTWHRKALGAFYTELERFAPDVVHIQFPTQGYDLVNGLVWLAARARLALRLPVVVTLHEFLPATFHTVDRYIYALALIAHRIVVVRPAFHEQIPLPARILVRKAKIRFIGNASAVAPAALTAEERRAIAREAGREGAALVAFFGFSFRHKGVDLLFRIADAQRHHLLLIGEFDCGDAYHQELRGLAESAEWRGRVTITGFVDSARAGRLLAAAEAIVFPYREGGGEWNSSLHAAMSQDTFVLLSSRDKRGYDAGENVYYARPGDIDEMRSALAAHLGTRRPRQDPGKDPWREIALGHRDVYASIVGRSKAGQ